MKNHKIPELFRCIVIFQGFPGWVRTLHSVIDSFTREIGQNDTSTFGNVIMIVLSRDQVTGKYMTCDRIDNIYPTVIICKHDEKVTFKTACEIYFSPTVENMIFWIIASTTVTNTEENRLLSGLYLKNRHCGHRITSLWSCDSNSCIFTFLKGKRKLTGSKITFIISEQLGHLATSSPLASSS